MVAILAVTALAVTAGAVFVVLRPVESPAQTRTAASDQRRDLTVRDLARLAPQADLSQASPPPVTPTPVAVASGGPGITLTPPRLFVVSPSTLPARVKQDIARLGHVQKVDSFDGGAVRLSGATLNLLAVEPARFRAWAPRAVADQPRVWEALNRGELVADSAATGRLGLVLGARYQVDAGPVLRVAASASFGLLGVDGLVSAETGRRLGLLPGVALLVNGPEKKVAAMDAGVREVLGSGAQVVVVGGSRTVGTRTAKARTEQVKERAATRATVGRPGSYLELYRKAAAVCPGLSWTVLAAIGQVESSHGRNNGPSSAGALGPMQFMPATWKVYGVDGDGDGVSDIWSPYDAVPGAANYLCANGAGQGGRKLEKAVWFYNHSWAYVNKVLSTAQAYARAYP
ncbi:lytic transglycosylase domain-containing protein [Streptosporangium saharense]|uniref:lytic transglycosylase domain-containing protein n=1 Tax=Streptosporangium saharense TaxID=1706840 RepID=UPI00331B65C6